MKKIINKLYNTTSKIIRRLVGKKNPAEIQFDRVKPWTQINGDKTLRLEYPLDATSTVVDVGGFEGQWASDIYAKYCCKIFIFEPVQNFADQIKKRFILNKNIVCYDIGLSNKNIEIEISLSGDKSSLFKTDSGMEKIKIVNTSEFLTTNKISIIDLMKMNIEGAEYDLLENIIDSGFVKNINNIQIQFHDFVPNANERKAKIQDQLSKTHHLTYQYEFVWENWEKNIN